MNYCYDGHDPVYKIKYKPVRPGAISSAWFVCEECFGREEFFGEADEIESITSLRNFNEIRLEIDQLHTMTRTVSKKLQKLVSLN